MPITLFFFLLCGFATLRLCVGSEFPKQLGQIQKLTQRRGGAEAQRRRTEKMSAGDYNVFSFFAALRLCAFALDPSISKPLSGLGN
jgi:hypothetical protein